MILVLDGMQIPPLTFPGIERGARETHWDMSSLLYEGGAKANARDVGRLISEGRLGKAVHSRVELITKIHQIISDQLAAGGSAYTATNNIRFLRVMIKWAEHTGHPLDLATVQNTYLHWSDALVHRYQVIKDLRQSSAYAMASHVGCLLDAVLERSAPLISTTRLGQISRRKASRGSSTEKQNLADTFAFGHLLQDTCDILTVATVLNGPLPVRIPIRSGGEVVEWSGYKDWKALDQQRADQPGYERSLARFRRYESEGTLQTRYPLANRRCEAELLMFIGQTGMNLAQAHRLKLRHFQYASYIDGYVVRDRKARRGGDVLFEVFKEYKPHFERYLEWRRTIFPDSDALFPFVRWGGRADRKPPQFRLQEVCKSAGVGFVSPQKLRNTRVNWLLRRSGDVEQTAAMAQHGKQTLLGTYERPSQHKAMTEITRFWDQHDPTRTRTSSPAPGQCDGKPVPLRALPKGVIEPDCIRPSGCLWCEHHRDIDTLDHVWGLASFRHLKITESAKWNRPRGAREIHPADHAIDRISDKLRWFRDSSDMRRGWVEEALLRVEEGHYHHHWSRLIAAIEGSP